MAALGIGAPIFLAVQGLISVFVYAELQNYPLRRRLIACISVFTLGVVAAVLLGSVIEIIGAELLVIFLYLLVQTAFRRRSSSV